MLEVATARTFLALAIGMIAEGESMGATPSEADLA